MNQITVNTYFRPQWQFSFCKVSQLGYTTEFWEATYIRLVRDLMSTSLCGPCDQCIPYVPILVHRVFSWHRFATHSLVQSNVFFCSAEKHFGGPYHVSQKCPGRWPCRNGFLNAAVSTLVTLLIISLCTTSALQIKTDTSKYILTSGEKKSQVKEIFWTTNSKLVV